MADVALNVEYNNPKELLEQGLRAFVLQDFSTSVQALSKASELLVEEHKDELHDSLGDVYLLYGKALLGLSREENDALGDAVPKNADSESEEEGEEGEPEGEEEETKTNGDSSEEPKTNGTRKTEEGEKKPETEEKEAENKDEEMEEAKPSGSGDAANETADEDPSDLRLAWEVLELAKKIFTTRGESGKKNLAETMICLGEISLESESFESAINDIKEGLSLQKTVFSKDSRTVAETLYKLGMAYSTDSQVDEAIRCFNESLEYLRNRINILENPDQQDKEASKQEAEEIKSLIPDIEEKIVDMKAYKEEAVKKFVSAFAGQQSSAADGAGSSTAKPATDISHLVKRKRKLEDIVEAKNAETEPQAKKPSPLLTTCPSTRSS